MYEFNDDYQKGLQEAWAKYIEKGEFAPDHEPRLRPVIYESWKRSKAFGVSPMEVKDRILSKEELDTVLEENKKLISVAHPYLMGLYKYMKGSNFVLALTDAHGTVIDLVRGQEPDINSRAKKSGLTLGCNRSEQYAGTCGIGTCLAIGAPIQIWGEEHYIKPHHGYTCSAAPIHDKKGAIIGCLDAIGPKEISPIHTLAMVSASVDGIEKELKISEAYDQLHLAHNQMLSTLHAINSGILMINGDGIITQHNNSFLKMLKIKSHTVKGLPLSQVISIPPSAINPLTLEKDIFNQEFSVKTPGGEPLSFSLTVTMVQDPHGDKNGKVLVFDETKYIHKLANKISGFSAKYTFDSIIGTSEAIARVKTMGQSAAQSSSNVLILGESGTGKELLAQAIHNGSDRRKGPFIAINCGSLPKGLIESELFGYEKGAFTGANKDGQPGKFELADGGTLFLDEIGDMPLELQAALLRVLQNREIVRIGGTASIQVDVRIMSATNVNLLDAVQDKRFRSDLYYRLNVLSIHIPPLRTRPEDIPVLVYHFIQTISHKLDKHIQTINEKGMLAFLNYKWPGNVRELENSIERAVNFCESSTIDFADLPRELRGTEAVEGPTAWEPNPYQDGDYLPPLPANFESMGVPTFVDSQNKEISSDEKSIILLINALQAEKGNISKVSERLGIPRRTLYRRLEKYNIKAEDYRLL